MAEFDPEASTILDFLVKHAEASTKPAKSANPAKTPNPAKSANPAKVHKPRQPRQIDSERISFEFLKVFYRISFRSLRDFR